jgi:hypothetical protein
MGLMPFVMAPLWSAMGSVLATLDLDGYLVGNEMASLIASLLAAFFGGLANAFIGGIFSGYTWGLN